MTTHSRCTLPVRLILSTAVFLFAVQELGCKRDSNPVGASASGSGKIVAGAPVDAGSMLIGPGGGTFMISRPGTPIDGLEIRVPGNAYEDARTFQVSYAPIQSHQFGTNFNVISPLITIRDGGGYAETIISMKIPVKIPSGHFAMGFFYDDETGELEGLPLLGHDTSSITVGTRHFAASSFSSSGFPKSLFRPTADPAVRANVVIASIRELELVGSYDTQFRPGVDDWGFPNYGSYVAPAGHCAGQSVGALWYFNEKKAKGSPALWMRFDNDGGSPKTPGIWQDDCLGYKFCSALQTSREKPSLGDALAMLLQSVPIVSDLETYNAFGYSILMSKKPQYVIIRSGLLPSASGHAMIIYGLVGKQLFVCDPNYPGDQERRIVLNTLFFDPYFSGPDASNLGKAYSHIFYAGFSPVIDLHSIDSRWKEVASKTIGNEFFPAYTVLVENDTLQLEELKDGFTKSDGHFRLEVRGNGFSSFFQVFEPGGTVLASDSPFDLGKGSHRIGVTVYDRDTNWVGFHWYTVNAGADTADIVPLAVGSSWTYTYTAYQSNGSASRTEQRIYSLSKDTVFEGERWYQFDMADSSGTAHFAFITNRSDGNWWAPALGAASPFLRFKYPASAGDTYASGVDGLTTMKVLEKDVSTTLPLIGTFDRCYVYQQTTLGRTVRGILRLAPGVGVLQSSEYEQNQGGGEYLAREEVLKAYSLK
jgi:hypothetical protein